MKRILIFLGIILIGWLIFKKGWSKSDFKLGIVTLDRVALLSISPQRGMINLMTVDPEVNLWLPGGMGWYPSNKIKKIYENEKNTDLIKEMFYYNFGFVPDKLAFLTEVNEWRNWDLAKYLGVVDWARYLVDQEKWLYKTETIKRSLDLEKESLDEILPRDFSDNELQSEEIKISVINATEENGLGSFAADRLNWMGFNVVSVRSEDSKTECEIAVKKEAAEVTRKYTGMVAKMFKCSQVNDESLLPDEAILYLGQNYVSMIKYSSYKK